MLHRSLQGTGVLCLSIAAVVTIFTIGGCARKTVSGLAAPAVPQRLPVHRSVIGRSLEGRDIECMTIGQGAIPVLFIATIHGDEPAGTPLLHRLEREAATNPPWMHDRTVVLVPLANPDGFAAQRRGNARGVDLNRNFPADSFTSRRRHGAEPLSEPESLALHALILAHRPHRVVPLHQPLGCIDYDGDGAALAGVMAEAIAEPYCLQIRKLGAYPGSLGSFAGEDLGIPTITVEFPAGAHRLSDDELWSRYGAMLIAAIAQP